ncbi:MAG: nucleotidyltransferase domain-containing protein [Candidatus Aenigmatarchaeota archaeon]
MDRETLLSYAMSFLSFSFRRPEFKAGDIRMAVVFGSIARGDFGKDSDVDIFIDTEKKKEEDMRKKFLYFAGKFRDSEDCAKWRMLGIENEISVNVGNIEEWELRDNVMREGVMLYGRPSFQKKRQYLVTFEPVKDVTARNRLIRALFGRMEKHYQDEGLVRSFGGEVLSPRSFFIPEAGLKKIAEILSREKVNYRIKEIWRGE